VVLPVSVHEILSREGKRRILAIDGGGIRGLVALGALEEIERILKTQSGTADFRLANYFDLIAGTSTGAVIAAGLAIGLSVAKIRTFYEANAAAIFARSRLSERLRSKYDSEGLTQTLKQIFGEETLGSDRLQTLVLFVMQNASTDSPWLVTNNPNAKYNDRSREDCNLNLPIWQLVRASAAAPTFFAPEEVQLGKQNFAFIDGATTPYNNPSFQAFLIATLDRYRLSWSTGIDQMLLVSVGTGAVLHEAADIPVRDMNILYVAKTMPLVQIGAASVEQDLLCRVFGRCLVGEPIDSEVDDLIDSNGPVQPKLFTYLRYNLTLTAKAFAKYNLSHIDPDALGLDAIDYMAQLTETGVFLGRQVRPEHFAQFAPPSESLHLGPSAKLS
jgi:patatin-like phospholipase/acyl hydrolase